MPGRINNKFFTWRWTDSIVRGISLHPMDSLHYRTARALFPHRPEMWGPDFIYEPLPTPPDHPELDLFGFERARPLLIEEGNAPACEPPESDGANEAAAPARELMRARMLNEFVYCPRLFYYEQVEGLFLENADTERGAALHEKIDRGRGAMPRARQEGAEPAMAGPVGTEGTAPAGTEGPAANESVEAEAPGEVQPELETIHSRSAMMSSEKLGVVAKMDLIEMKVVPRDEEDLFAVREVASVTPVDYKAGAPRQGPEANELWDADKMQLGLQILVLRENGYRCDDGVIFYRATRQRVRLAMTRPLEQWIRRQIEEARKVAAAPQIPPPLVNSPKCVRCSLAPICLPDETRLLTARSAAPVEAHAGVPAVRARAGAGQAAPPRRLIAARDDERALYLNTQGCRVGLKSERLVIKDGESVVDEIRLNDVTHVALFGNIQISTQAVQELCEQEIPVAYFSQGGWFYGLTRGHGLKNVFTRIQQFGAAGNPLRCLEFARKIVQAKIRNHRTLLMRLHVEPPAPAVVNLREIAARVPGARGLDELLGMEGAAAAIYFQHFSGMIKAGEVDAEDEIPGLEMTSGAKAKLKVEAETFNFDFQQRRRRPPTDPVNALLSLAYSLLAKDCTIAALAVGFDPYVGFFHQPRHGRPALALDLMEEFRPLVAESAVLTAINNRMVVPSHFVRAGDAVNLTPLGRRAFFHAYEQRMNALITHPVFDYKVSYRRVLELQARLLARWLTGEIPDYVPMVTR